MDSLRVSLFMDFSVRFRGEVIPILEVKKARELLAYLLLNRGRPHRRELLMALLWEDTSESRAQKHLRQILWQLQSDLDPYSQNAKQRTLQVDLDWVQIDPQIDIWCDAVEFTNAFQSTQGTTGYMLNAAQVHELEEAVALYKGDLLEGWYQTWCLIEREHLQNMYLIVLEKLMDSCEAHSHYEQGIEYGMRALKKDYARERTYRRLMRLYTLMGDRNSAIRQYYQCSAALLAELNVAPSEQTQLLFEMICRDELPQGRTIKSLSRPISTNTSDNLVDHLMHLHSNLGEIQTLIQQEINAVKRFYSLE